MPEWVDARRGPSLKDEKGLDLREDPIKGPCVSGIKELEVDTAEAILELLERGNQIRHQASTAANNESSRSHAVFQIMVETTACDPVDADDRRKTSK